MEPNLQVKGRRPRLPDPLFPVLHKMTAEDVRQARSWLLAWMLAYLADRVQPIMRRRRVPPTSERD